MFDRLLTKFIQFMTRRLEDFDRTVDIVQIHQLLSSFRRRIKRPCSDDFTDYRS